MVSDTTAGMENDAKLKWAVLSRLASVLNVPVERFFADVPPPETDISADECLRLWSKIKTSEGRRQAMEALRVIAELERT